MKIAVWMDRGKMVRAAMGEIPCDLTVCNIQLVNMFSGEVYPAQVDILDGIIVRVRTDNECPALPSERIFDGGGRYLIPGFIDSHLHVESTMMVPENFGRAVLPWGTTTIVMDPHEIANVLGIEGVSFMLDNAKKTPLRQFALAPSCVLTAFPRDRERIPTDRRRQPCPWQNWIMQTIPTVRYTTRNSFLTHLQGMKA